MSDRLKNFLDGIATDEPYGGDSGRPYLGQPWTPSGKRGQHEVRGLTMRDIGDCIARGRAAASEAGPPCDVAAIQNALCEMEKMMGIFPNISEDADPWDDIPVIDLDMDQN